MCWLSFFSVDCNVTCMPSTGEKCERDTNGDARAKARVGRDDVKRCKLCLGCAPLFGPINSQQRWNLLILLRSNNGGIRRARGRWAEFVCVCACKGSGRQEPVVI